MQEEEKVLKEGWCYKATANSDLVVARRIHMRSDGSFLTFHDFKNQPENARAWLFDRKCELVPQAAEHISGPQRKQVRAKGTW